MEVSIYIYNLGCPKNEVDGQYYAGVLAEDEDIEIVDDYREAEILIINTCGFIDAAKEESLEAIWEAVELKNEGKCERVIVSGCLSQRYHQHLEEEIPELDGIFGVGEYEGLLSLVNSVKEGQKTKSVTSPRQNINKRLPRRADEKSFAYLKIADGCNKRCSYCAIPFIKGDYSSRSQELIEEEAEKLLENNVSELILIAQDTTQYGIDIYGETRLEELLKSLLELSGLERLRIMYTYLEQIDEELLHIMACEERLCSYLDLPIQHVAGPVRKNMKRPGDINTIREKLDKIREIVPDIALRTSLLVGFPGETEEDFQKLKEFVREIEFERLGVFMYSREEGTEAAELPGQLPEELKQRRYNELVELQEKISRSQNRQLVGKIMDVIIDEVDGGSFSGRTEYDAPEIDNIVRGELPDGRELRAGEIVKCRIESAFEYELVGEIINEPS